MYTIGVSMKWAIFIKKKTIIFDEMDNFKKFNAQRLSPTGLFYFSPKNGNILWY